ncbi:hypothetical protein HK405_009911, partial [Cladochytrium tenue]
MPSPTFWASQSPTSAPSPSARAAIAALPADIAALHAAATQLMLHYRVYEQLVRPERRDEIHTRYADLMLDRILSRGEPASLSRKRTADDRTVGCCRDVALLFVTLAREKGIPARMRVGFASYFNPGWWMDHVVAEVWEEEGSTSDGKVGKEGRWRMIDPEMELGWKSEGGKAVDFLDLRRGVDFKTGGDAWLASRNGDEDPTKYIVDPSLLDIPPLRGWVQIANNVVLDLSAMAKKEMLQWDMWGMLLEHGESNSVPEGNARLLDEVSDVLQNLDVEPEVVKELAARDGLAVTKVIMSHDVNI